VRTRIGGTALALALLVPTTAMAVSYPAPSDPGGTTKRPKNTRTLHVCKHGKGCIKTIQKAVKQAKAGDTIRIAHGTYREAVTISGRKKAFLRLIGDAKNPGSVVIDGSRKKQNTVFVNGANNVTVSGITARNYAGNGFFVLNVDGYDLNHLVAHDGGVYGLYAFNSKGGRMTDSVAYYNNDGGFYIGQTPVQTKPKRSIAKNDVSWGNVIGWSGTNMRYVTITKSKFFNNGTGVVPNALDSEKYAPAEDNVIADNDVFWNNFNYHAGAPFKLRASATSFPYPTGVGILLFGGHRNLVQNNRVYGNYLAGIGAIDQFLLKQQDAAHLENNKVTGNQLGLGGADLNGRDLFYDGSGTGNCFQDNATTTINEPQDNSVFAPCPGPSPNAFRQDMRDLTIKWATDPPEQNWIRHPHAAKPGYNALEEWTKAFKPGSSASKARAAAAPVASAAGKRTVKVGDYFLSPGKLTIAHGTKVTWRWLPTNGDTHDVKLRKAPRGVKSFHSGYASTDYSFTKKLTRTGTYKVVCTLHPTEMHETIVVK
jgi:plastocyanin